MFQHCHRELGMTLPYLVQMFLQQFHSRLYTRDLKCADEHEVKWNNKVMDLL